VNSEGGFLPKAKSFLNILRKQNISLRREAQYRSTARLNIARRKANIAENAGAFSHFLFFFMPKKRRRMGARSPGERIITIFITSS
jgi:hypothetical protein